MAIKRKSISRRIRRGGEGCTIKEEDYEQIKEEKRIVRRKRRSTRSGEGVQEKKENKERKYKQ
jgi:hypothetical protein